MKNGPITKGICPKCGAELSHGPMFPEESSIYYEVLCTACPWQGKEYYRPEFEGFTSIDGKESYMLPNTPARNSRKKPRPVKKGAR